MDCKVLCEFCYVFLVVVLDGEIVWIFGVVIVDVFKVIVVIICWV